MPLRAVPAILAILLAVVLPDCAGSKGAPPPPMGELSGPWLLGTDGKPVRFLTAQRDTASLLVSAQPVGLRTGGAVSDTSVAVDVTGILVTGSGAAAGLLPRASAGELVTAGTSAGRFTFFSTHVVFEGRWSDGGFTGTYRIDPEQAAKGDASLDGPQPWTLRRLGNESLR
jgi:hypothetical protein